MMSRRSLRDLMATASGFFVGCHQFSRLPEEDGVGGRGAEWGLRGEGTLGAPAVGLLPWGEEAPVHSFKGMW